MKNKNDALKECLFGFEVEMVWPAAVRPAFGALKSMPNMESVYSDVSDSLAEVFGEGNARRIGVCSDPSIDACDSGGRKRKMARSRAGRRVFGTGIEVVTPPLPAELALAVLEDVFGWMRKNGAFMNSSCGLHLNVSFINDRKTRRVSYLKLAREFDARKWLKEYGREDNCYCRPSQELMVNMGRLLNAAAAAAADKMGAEKTGKNGSFAMSAEDAGRLLASEEFAEELKERLGCSWLESAQAQGKKHAVCQRWNSGRRYFEFRVAGGGGCSGGMDKIRALASECVSAMSAALEKQPVDSMSGSGSGLMSLG